MSEFSSIDNIDLDELFPAGEQPAAPKEQKIEKEFVRPEPVSPAPPPSAGSGSDLFPDKIEESKGVSGAGSYLGETYKDLGITLPDNLKEDLGGEDAVAPQTEVEKGMVAPTPFTEGQWGHAGEVAFDMVAMRDKVAESRAGAWTRRFIRDNQRAPTQEESSQKYIEFAAQANDEIYDLANKVRGARASALPGSQGVPRRFLWLDIDPGGKLYGKGLLGISAAKQEDRDFISKVAAPFIVSMAGVEQNLLAEDVDEEGRIGQKMVKTPYNESHALGFLDWVGRQSLLSYAATAAVAGASEDQDSWAAGRTPWALINPVNYYRGWGSNKQLELLSRGEDIVSLADELQLRNMSGAKYILEGAEALGIISPETSEKGQQLSEFATAFGLALVDPDLFSVMTLGAGKLAKTKAVTKVGDILGTSTTAKTAARQQAAETASKNLADLAVSQESDSFEVGSKIDQILNTLDPEQKQIALTQARIMVASDPKASKLTEALANRAIIAKRLQNPPKKIAQQTGIRGRASTENIGKLAAKVEKGEAVSPKFKREAFKEGDNLDAYKQAQLEDMWAASALADAETQKRLATNLRSGTRASKATKAAVSYDQLKAVSDEVQAARKEMKEAFLETATPRGTGKYDESKQTAKYAKAKKRQELAVARFNDLALQMATNTADDAEVVLDQLIATAKLQKKQSAAKLKNITKAINKKGDFKVNPKEHQYIVNSIVKNAPKALEQRALISALSVALGEQAAAYGKLNKFIKETPGAGSAIGGVSRAAELYKKSAEAGEEVVGTILKAGGQRQGLSWRFKTSVGIKGISTAEEFGENIKEFKTAREAVEFIAKNAEDASYREIAKRILDEIPDIPLYLIDETTSRKQLEAMAKQTSVDTVNDIIKGTSRGLLYSDAQSLGGPKVPKGILIRGAKDVDGRDAETLLHELMHAATTAKIYEFKRLKDSPEYHKVYKDLSSIQVYARKALREARKKADLLDPNVRGGEFDKLQNIPLWFESSALKNIDELVAYGFTNQRFRDFLKTVEMPGKNNTAWSKFVGAITRILGLNERIADGSQTALDRLLRSVDELIDLPAPAGKAIKVVNGKIVDEVGESISRMAADVPTAAADVRRADDLYTLEQVELTTGWFSKGNKEGNFVRSLNFMGDGLKNFWNPAQKVLGPASEELHQIGISSLGMIRKVHSDMVRKLQPAVKQAGDEAEALAIEQKLSRNEIQAARVKAESLAVKAYFTSTESINGSFMNTIFEGRSLWDMAKPMLRSTTGASNQEDSSMAFNSLYKMWLPPGEDLTPKVRAALEKTGRNLLKYGQATEPKNFKKADAATKEKYKQAADNLSFDEFSEGMRDATDNVFKGQGKVDPNAVRVNYFALEAVSQMAIMNMASTRMNKVLADFPQESIEAAVRLASGDSLNPGQDFVEATKVLNKLKIPGPLRVLGTEGNKQIEVGLRMYSDGYGNKAFVPHQWMQQTSELLSKIEKTAEAYGTKVLDPWEQKSISTYQGIYRIWHSAILTGLFIPRAAYFTNIYVGNFGQLLSRQGFMAAARYTKDSAKDVLVWAPQELARQTPLGKYVDAGVARMDAKLGTEFHLASPTNAIINRHISMMMDPSIADNATKITGKTGATFTMGELRRFAVEQGVFTSFADSAGLSNLLSRTNPGFGKKFWDQIKQGGPLAKRYADFADTLEQRQRVGLFTDLVVNRGMSPEEAGKVVRDALYDWDSPMTALETAFAKKMFMFYNFTRRAMGQGMRILLDPYLSATTDTAAEGVLRSSPFLSMLTGKPAYQSANVMAMERTRRELSEYMADEDTAAEYPWWAKKAHNKMFLPNSPMGQERAASYSQTLGKDVNYKVTTVPSLTPIEMVNQWGDMARILGAYGVSWAVDTPMNIIYPEGARPSTVTFKDDVLVPMMGKVAEQAGPFGEEAVQALMDSISNDKQSYISGGVNVNRLSDRKILEWLEQMGPFMSGIAWEDDKNPGRVRTSASTYALLKLLPTISNDVNTIMGPYLDVSAEGGEVSEALLETLTSYAGFKTYRYSPQQVKEWDRKVIRDKMGAIAREENRKIPLGSTKPELMPAQKSNLLQEEEVPEFSNIEDLLIE